MNDVATIASHPLKNIAAARGDFPILRQQVNGKPLVYLDSAATTQKPQTVIDAMANYYSLDNSNIHRGVHTLSERATLAYETSRKNIKDFLGARDAREIIFVRGATEAINLVAQAFCRPRLMAGDEVIITTLEHHANIVPWQVVCQQTGAILKVVAIDDDGNIDMNHYQQLLSGNTKMVAVSQVSNAIGTIVPVKKIISLAHDLDVPVLIDGAQAIQHLAVDMQELDCDFYVFSGHKCYGPTGVGVLYGKLPLLQSMSPYQTGGGMIKTVTFEKTNYSDLPEKLEAGTPHIAGAIGLAVALRYLTELGVSNIADYENTVLSYAEKQLASINTVRIIGKAVAKASALSFTMEGIHPHDIGTVLDSEGVAIRVGHHCAMPLMARLGLPATARVSIGMYNNQDDIDALCEGLLKIKRLFS